MLRAFTRSRNFRLFSSINLDSGYYLRNTDWPFRFQSWQTPCYFHMS